MPCKCEVFQFRLIGTNPPTAIGTKAVTGAVDISTTPVVEYTYSSPANGSRITSMVYPDHTFSKADIGTRPNGRTGRKTGTHVVS